MRSLLETLPIEYRQFRESIIKLSNLVVQIKLFPPAHPSCRKALSEAFVHFDSMLRSRSRIVVSLDDRSFFHLNFELSTADSSTKTLSILYNLLSRLSVDEMEFVRGLTKEELEAFAKVVGNSTRISANELSEELFSIHHIKLRRKKEIFPKGDLENSSKARIGANGAKNQSGQSSVQSNAITQEISRVLEKLNKLNSSKGEAAAGRLLNIVSGDLDAAIVLLLNSLKNFDDYTFTHSINVAVIASALAKAAGLSEDEVNSTAIAGLMHDIGKLYVPKKIIHKPSRLNPMEWALMKRHPLDGERILREEGMEKFLCRVAYEHHMKYDLTGYPKPKSKRNLLEMSHIVRIADTYDAITTRRPYRKQLSPYEAVKFMSRFSGTEFHPAFLKVFVRMLGNVPIGTVVKLNTGEEAVVINVRKEDSGDVMSSVRILKDAEGNPVSENRVIDLGEDVHNEDSKRIVAVVDDTVRDVDIGLYLS